MTSTRDQSWPYLLAALVVLGAAVAVWVTWPQQPLYVLGALVLLCLLAWIVRQPLHGILLTIVAVGLLPQAPQEIGFRELAFLAILGTTLAAWLFKSLLARRLTVPASPIAVALIALFGVFLFSLPIALARGTTLYEWARGLAPFVPMLVFFVIATEARDARAYRRLLWAFLLIGGGLAGQTVFTFWQERLWEPVFIPEVGPIYRRITWIFDAATSPLILAGAIIALVEALFEQGWLKRLAFWGVAFFLSGAIVLTLSRSEIAVLISIAISTIFIVLLKGRLRLTRLAWQLGLVGLLLVAIVVAEPASPIWELIQSRGQALVSTVLNFWDAQSPSSMGDVNILARLDEIRIALEAFAKQPLVGQGLGYSYEVPPAILGEGTFRVQYVHNIIAYFLMTTGLLGTSVFVILVVIASFVFWHKYWRETSTEWDRVLVAAGSALAALWLYALFFAVFRTLSFNLVVGVTLALLASHCPVRAR